MRQLTTKTCLLTVSIMLTMSATACEQLGRQGGACGSDADCAMGLTCIEMFCQGDGVSKEPGLASLMKNLRREAAKVPPREQVDIPQVLLDQVRAAGEEVRIDIFTSRHLPEEVTLVGGEKVSLGKAAEQLAERVGHLVAEVPSVRLGKRLQLSEEQAVQERLQISQTSNGVPVFVGVVIRQGVRREVVPLVKSPDEVDYALATGFWRFNRKKEGRLRVGFVCGSGAFCPRLEQKPTNPKGGEWADEITGTLSQVFEAFDDVRVEATQQFHSAGIEPVMVTAGQPLPKAVSTVAILSPIRATDDKLVSWLKDLRAQGVGVVAFLPGARFVASSGQVVAIDRNDASLLEALGARRTQPLLVDRASLTKFNAPARPDAGVPAEALPLVAEVGRLASLHEAIAGLMEPSLPMTSVLAPLDASGQSLLAWSRPGVSVATLPFSSRLADVDAAAPVPQAGGEERALIVAQDVDGRGRSVVVGSGMAFVVMSALELIRNLDLKQDSALLARQLKAYARGAQAYLALHRANRTLRESTLGLWERLTYWVAEPQALRSLKP